MEAQANSPFSSGRKMEKGTHCWCLELQGHKPLPFSFCSDARFPGGGRRHQHPQRGD